MDDQKRIYKLVSRIPKGKVMTYGQIAKKLGIKSPRFVGQVLHRNIDPKKITCHRVVFADGSLSHSYAFGGIKKQKELLKSEGIEFKGGRVKIAKFLLK